MCIMGTGSNFHPFFAPAFWPSYVCQYHTFGLFFNHQLAVLQVSSFSSAIYLCGFLNKLQLFPIQTPPVLQGKWGRAVQAIVQRKQTFLSSLSLTQEKAFLRISFWKLNLQKSHSVFTRRLVLPFKFTLITSFWPKRQHFEEKGK